MRLLFGRHGLSDGNMNEENYIRDGDEKTGLAKPEGWLQAIAMGRFSGPYYKRTNTWRWPYIYVSGHLRAQQTLSGFLHGLGSNIFLGKPRLRQDTRLVEEFWGAASRMKRPDTHALDWHIAAQMRDLQRDVFEKDRFMTKQLFGESRMDVNMRVKAFLEGPVRRMEQSWFGPKDALIVCHGYVIQEFIRTLLDLPMDADIDKPGNCDVFEAIGSMDEGWTVRRIYDGEAMRPVDEPLMGTYKAFGLEDLPPVPVEIR